MKTAQRMQNSHYTYGNVPVLSNIFE